VPDRGAVTWISSVTDAVLHLADVSWKPVVRDGLCVIESEAARFATGAAARRCLLRLGFDAGLEKTPLRTPSAAAPTGPKRVEEAVNPRLERHQSI